MKIFTYRAYFNRYPYVVAYGEIEAMDKDDAKESIIGSCGEWETEDGSLFYTEGCPDQVEIYG